MRKGARPTPLPPFSRYEYVLTWHKHISPSVLEGEGILLEPTRSSFPIESVLKPPPANRQSSPELFSASTTSTTLGRSTINTTRSVSNPPVARAPQITLILPDQSGNLDFDRLVPASILRDSTLRSFLSFFADRTNIPLQSLHCLTFRHTFAGSSVKVVHASESEEAWEAFKRNLKKAFLHARNKFPAKKEFDIWVEGGDTSEDIEEEDNGGL